jgi:hypothetical protein
MPERAFQTFSVTGVYGNSGPRICATTESNSVVCRESFSEEETVEPTGGRAFVGLAVGDFHTCGITAPGQAWCWGENTYGQLGDGTMTNRPAPVAVHGGLAFSQITAGLTHTCGLTAAGAIYCWGHGSRGEMGDDKRDESAAPVSVDGTPPLTQVEAAPWGLTCGLDAASSVWCWPTSFENPAPQEIAGATGLMELKSPCGLRADGEMLCWASNYSGWFGNGTYNVTTQNAVPGGNGIRFTEVSFGRSGGACGIGLDGSTYCWGGGFYPNPASVGGGSGSSTLPVKLYGSP